MIILSLYLLGVILSFLIMFLIEILEHKKIYANFLVRDLMHCITFSLFSWASIITLVIVCLIHLMAYVYDYLCDKVGRKTLIKFKYKK
jgi:xanthine/uracil permease